VSSDLAAAVRHAQALHDAAVMDLTALGGILWCPECGTTRPLGDVAGYVQYGWPKCCGYATTWITRRELDEGAR